jgi:hypothetical protein
LVAEKSLAREASSYSRAAPQDTAMDSAAPEQSAFSDGVSQSLTERLASATGEIQQLEKLVQSGDLDGRVLSEFRNAVDHIRTTTWAVQKWVGLNFQAGGDPFSVLPTMIEARVRRATQIADNLCLDIQSNDLGIDTPGIIDLANSVEDLHRRLADLLRRKPAVSTSLPAPSKP